MLSRASITFLLLFIFVTSATSAAFAAENAKPTIEWLQNHAIPLCTVEAGHGFDDMLPIKKVIGDARIVELGEATHGTREFFQLKHRMLEFLATQMGFTIFSIEGNMPEAYRLNDFVLNGNGDPKQLLKGMYFWTWNTEEVLDMILWMREFNRSGKGHIEFTGFDMQTPTVAMDIVRTFVSAQDAEFYPGLEPIYQDLANEVQQHHDKSLRQTTLDQLLVAGTVSVVKHLEDNRSRYLRMRVAPQAVDWAIQNARVVLQYAQLRAKERPRDESMADNIRWIADQNPGAKIVIWAHNGHVTHGGYPGYKPMGAYLRETFGKDLINFGFAFNEGSFQAIESGNNPRIFTLGPAPEESLGRIFAAVHIPIFALDLRQIPDKGAVAEWFAEPHLSRSIGALFRDSEGASYFLNARPQDSYDAMFFVEKTSAARENQ